MAWLDALPWPYLLIAGGMLALAPFQPEPHLVEKVRMLLEGNLKKPIDIFDFLMHGTPLVIIAVKAIRQFVLKVI
jgi:hypothetical protein